MSSVILAGIFILGSALTLFGARYWSREKIKLMQENVKNIASVTTDMFDPGRDEDYMDTPSTRNSARILLNMLSTISKAIDSDIVVCSVDTGKVIYCKEQLHQNMIVMGGCVIHDNYVLSGRILDAVKNGSVTEISNMDGAFRERRFIVAEPIVIDDSIVGVVCATRYFANGAGEYVSDLLRMFLVSAALSLFIAFVVIYVMSYRMIKPLRQMAIATSRYSKGDFSYRVTIKDDDELGELAGALNAMAKALATMETSRRSFVANVSHELKTPMTTISGFIDGILDGTIPEDKHAQYLTTVSDEIKRLSRLVTGMLNMSKSEAGELELNITTFDLSDMVFKTLLSFEHVIENKCIEVHGLEEIGSVYVNADESMINQVVYNLVDNAIKFTEPSGYIAITLRRTEENTAFFSIRNSGAGIPSEELGKIFERFYKVDKSRSYDVKGAGLGLYIVKTIIDMHDGKITVDSVEGEYTEFSFELPGVPED